MTLPDDIHDPIAQEEARIAAERARLQRDAVGGSFWTSLQTIMGLPLAVVTNAVIAHRLGAGAYGNLAIYTAIYTVVVSLLNAGISDASVQWIATHKARNELDAMYAVVRRCSGYHIFIEAPLVAILMATLVRHAGGLAMLVGAVSAGFVMVVGTSTVVMSGAGLNALAARIALGATLASQTAIILVVAESPVSTSVFIGRTALGLIGPLLALILIPSALRAAVLRPRFPREWPPGFVAYALRTCASGVVTSLVFGRSELFVFEAYGHTEQAGLFALAAGVAGLITAPIDALLGPLLPATAGLMAISPERAGDALLRGLRTSALLAGLVAAVGIPVLAPLLPLIYGSSFAGTTAAFVALAAVSCLQSVNHPIFAFLMAGRRAVLLLRASMLAVVLDVTIAFATIPSIGVSGAVIASCVAQVTVLGIVAVQVGRLVGVSTWDQARSVAYFLDAVVIGATALTVEWLVRDLADVAVAAVGVGVAIAAVAASGRLRRSTGLAASDVEVIQSGLPRMLGGFFRASVAALALEIRTPRSAEHAHD